MILYYTNWNEHFGYKFSIDPTLASVPQWSKYEAFPPLSPRIAIANSRLFVQRLLTEVQPFDPLFSSVCLTSQSEHEVGWWYYVVKWFVPDLEDIAIDWSEFSVPVLFDGTTPVPTKFKYEDRSAVYRAS